MLIEDSVNRLFDLVAVAVIGLAHALLLCSVTLALLEMYISTELQLQSWRADVEPVMLCEHGL
jgi:hypothetical protein